MITDQTPPQIFDPTRAAPNSGAIPVEPYTAAQPAPVPVKIERGAPGPMQPSGGGFARPALESGRTNAIEELYRMYCNHYYNSISSGPMLINCESNIECLLPASELNIRLPEKLLIGPCELNISSSKNDIPDSSVYFHVVTEYLSGKYRESYYYKNFNNDMVIHNRYWFSISVPDLPPCGVKITIVLIGPCSTCCIPKKHGLIKYSRTMWKSEKDIVLVENPTHLDLRNNDFTLSCIDEKCKPPIRFLEDPDIRLSTR